jgi:hypothetical protein
MTGSSALNDLLNCCHHAASVVPVTVRQDNISDGSEIHTQYSGVALKGLALSAGVKKKCLCGVSDSCL